MRVADVDRINNNIYSALIMEDITVEIDTVVSDNTTSVYEDEGDSLSTNTYTVKASVNDKPDSTRWRGYRGADKYPFASKEDSAKVTIWLRDMDAVGLSPDDFTDLDKVRMTLTSRPYSYNVESRKDIRDLASRVISIRFILVK